MLKKHLKKIVSLVLVTMMAIGMSITAIAAEPIGTVLSAKKSVNTGTAVSSATFELVPISRQTFWGDSGSCTLDYLSEGYIQWTITIPGTVITSFEANLHFNKLGTPFVHLIMLSLHVVQAVRKM